MTWLSALSGQLAADRFLIEQVAAGRTAADLPCASFVHHQQSGWALAGHQIRLPEHFRGDWEQARVCFLGPHIQFLPGEQPPAVGSTLDEYVGHYRHRPERRDPYGHYHSIAGGGPWLATELVHWPCRKEFALDALRGPLGAGLVAAALDSTWALLRASPVTVLVLTGNDALRWVLPHLGWQGKALPGVTQLHGQVLGQWPLPGEPRRQLTVVASFHWSAEMPMFVRRVPGLGDRPVGQAISSARRMVAAVIESALAGGS